ncbi:MAG: hypothetical protein GY869_04510, partial [Planctomycetes bacterium]|nr:hypothetical protein [Planctomycetota bacterium]
MVWAELAAPNGSVPSMSTGYCNILFHEIGDEHNFFGEYSFTVRFIFNGDDTAADIMDVTINYMVTPYAEVWYQDAAIPTPIDRTIRSSIANFSAPGQAFEFDIWVDNCAEVDQLQLELTDLEEIWDTTFDISVASYVGGIVAWNVIDEIGYNTLTIELAGGANNPGQLDLMPLGPRPLFHVTGMTTVGVLNLECYGLDFTEMFGGNVFADNQDPAEEVSVVAHDGHDEANVGPVCIGPANWQVDFGA